VERAGRIILVRHGETEANRLGRFAESNEIPLTEAGRRQAWEVADRLAAEFRPTRLLSSGFLRARETSEIIGRTLGLEVAVIEGIHERDFGCLKGHAYARMGELMSSDPACDPSQSWLWIPAGGESLDDVRRRAIAVLQEVRKGHPDQEVVVVCHGAVIQAVCAHITGEWSEASVPANCGIVVIEHDRLNR
jgi:probable phosphoglycerate mutase